MIGANGLSAGKTGVEGRFLNVSYVIVEWR